MSPFSRGPSEPVDASALAACRARVTELVRASGCVPPERVDGEVSWFFEELGIDDSYFVGTEPEQLRSHVLR